MYIPPVPQTQALSSSTFKAPVLDGSLTIPEIFDWQAKNSPSHRAFVFSREDGTKQTILWPEFVRACHVAAKFIHNLTAGQSGQVVAVLAPSETISYATIVFGTMRANCTIFPISPRNSAMAVAHLISKVDVRHILVGREQAMVDLATRALEILSKQENTTAPTATPIPLFDDLYLAEDTHETTELVAYNRKSTDIGCYLHSSGSTAFPKPIPYTHHRLIQTGLIPWFGDRDLTDTVVSFAVIPMFHGMGVVGTTWAATCGLVISTLEPNYPVTVPTADNLFLSAKATETDLIFSVPSIIEAWRNQPEYVEWIATRGGILYSGGPMNKQTGDYLTSQGVSIFIVYGATEGGFMSRILPATVGYDWDYFEFADLVTAEMVSYGDGTFELVMVENPYCRPGALNRKINGKDAYATSDLLIPHPTKSGFWKIYGRADDQIMHNTGEKTNPGPLESMMNQHPKVLASVMFGRGRFQAGIIVDPKPEFEFDPENLGELAKFRNELWPTVEKMNEYAPQHSKLFKEMITVSKPAKPFTYTAKNTARRQAIINDYEEEIDELYDLVSESTQSTIPPPTSWDIKPTRDFVRNVVLQVLGKTCEDDDDLFEHGCDSLQATWIRNSLLRALRDSAELDTRKRTQNFVYRYPTISTLTAFVHDLAGGRDEKVLDSRQRVEEMLALVKKYSSDLPSPSVKPTTKPAKDVVILVGSTGAIGCQTLVSLALDDSVERVYALNRKHATMSLVDRQRQAFVERGLSTEILESPKVSLLEVDFGANGFGLEPCVFETMHQTATHIIHNAWRVDFNLGLSSFESNIRIIRRMLEFALTSPVLPRFLFVSSIGVFQSPDAANLPRPIKESRIPAAVAVGTGYSESKWVVEEMLAEVGLETLVVRVGQVSGARNGAWNVKEWFPSLVQASIRLGCLPTFEQEKLVSWVPVQQVADVLNELRHAAADTNVVHLVHPKPVTWTDIVEVLAVELGLKLVPYDKWLQQLEAECSLHPDRLNAVSLLPFFRSISSRLGDGWEAFGLPELDTTKTRAVCKSFGDRRLGEPDVKSYIGYWNSTGRLL